MHLVTRHPGLANAFNGIVFDAGRTSAAWRKAAVQSLSLSRYLVDHDATNQETNAIAAD